MPNSPSFTEVYSSTDDFIPEPGSAYIFCASIEERSGHQNAWAPNATGVDFVPITEQRASRFTFSRGTDQEEVQLRSSQQIGNFVKSFVGRVLYIDLTGLAHHIWAPLIRASLAEGLSVRVIYVEPSDYRHTPTPTEGDIFDLSERIQGISPIPGFAFLSDSDSEDFIFVPLLGFEGPRFSYMVENVQPIGRKTFPVIGVPGFRLEYPFHTYHANEAALLETKSWLAVRYVPANCPFSLFYLLSEIAKTNTNEVIKIATIGTKPHALGAILFYIANSQRVEIVYDHPIRKGGRSTGTSRLLVYHVSLLNLSN